MTLSRFTFAAGVLVAALAASTVAGGANDESKLVPKPDRSVQKLLAAFRHGRAPDKVIQALRAIGKERLSSALAYELIFYDRREAALHALGKMPALKPVEPALVHALQHGTNTERLLAIALVRKWDVKAAIPVLLGDVLESDYVLMRNRPHPAGHGPGWSEVVAGVFSSACKALHALTDGKIGMHLRPSGATGSHEAIKAKWRTWWREKGRRLYPDASLGDTAVSSEKAALDFCRRTIEQWGPHVEARVRKALADHAAECEVSPAPNRKNILPEHLGVPRDLWCESGVALLLKEAVAAGGDPDEVDDKARSRQRLVLLGLANTRPVHVGRVVSALAWLRQAGRVLDDVAWVESLRSKLSPATAKLLSDVLSNVQDPKTLFQGVEVLGTLTHLEAIPALVKMIGRVRNDGYTYALRDAFQALMARGPMHEKTVVKAMVPLLAHKDDTTALIAVGALGDAKYKVYIEVAIAAIESASKDWTGEKKRVAKTMIYLLKERKKDRLKRGRYPGAIRPR